MKKLISIFAVAFLLVFSCIPAFAESRVIDGYAVDDVPYNEAFDGVLTASDTNGSQIYSSSDDKTYILSSVASVPSTSASPIYSKKSVINMIPKNIWRGNNSPTITFPVNGEFTGVHYSWAENANPNKFYHQDEAPLLNFFKSERKYRISFDLSLPKVKGSFHFYLASRPNIDTPVIPLVSVEVPASSGAFLSQSSRSYSIDFTAPNGVSALTPIIKGTVYGKDFLFYVNNFTVTDITTEDLDNSINQGVDRIENAGSDEPPLDTDISAFSSAIDTMNGWLDQLNEFADSIDSAGDTAKDYISKGTELFNGFMSVAPASVIALIAFGVVFLVIRKIVGR